MAERGLGLRMFHSIPKFIFVPASSRFIVLKNILVFSSVGSCGKPEDIPDAIVSGSSYNYMDTLNYTCSKGYQLDGPETRTCLHDGKWSSSPTCTRKLTKELHKHNNCCNRKITKEGAIALFSICTEWEDISQAFFCYQGKRVQQPDHRHLKAKDAFTEYSKEIKNLLIVP